MMSDLGNVYLSFNKAFEMEEYARWQLYLRILPADDPSIAESTENLAAMYSDLGMH